MTRHVGSPEAFCATFAVSRETGARLIRFHDLLATWTRRINLVSPASLADAWHRHFADSAQLWRLRPPDARIWLDLGAGAGFPGLVVAALARDEAQELRVHLVESDQRKCAFLGTVIREADLPATVHATRIESLDLPPADVLSARALAPLSDLLAHAKTLRHPRGTALFPKGETVHKELAEAARLWSFEHRLHPSLTDPRAAIVEIGAVDGPRGPHQA